MLIRRLEIIKYDQSVEVMLVVLEETHAYLANQLTEVLQRCFHMLKQEVGPSNNTCAASMEECRYKKNQIRASGK